MGSRHRGRQTEALIQPERDQRLHHKSAAEGIETEHAREHVNHSLRLAEWCARLAHLPSSVAGNPRWATAASKPRAPYRMNISCNAVFSETPSGAAIIAGNAAPVLPLRRATSRPSYSVRTRRAIAVGDEGDSERQQQTY